MFLTLEDPRAAVKGSVDPLGVLPFWYTFGRHVVTNLTTVTSSVREFSVAMLARYFTERLIEEGRITEEDALPVFLRVEQLAAYARYIQAKEQGHEDEIFIRGISRVRKRVAEKRSRIRVGSDRHAMILSDQRTYGLWGLYSVASRASGMFQEGPVGLTPAARAFVEATYLPLMGRGADAVRDFVVKDGEIKPRLTDPRLKPLAAALGPRLTEREIAFYGEHVRDALHTKSESSVPGRQARLAALMTQHTSADQRVGRAAVRSLARAAEQGDPALAERLRNINRLEATIATADLIFALLTSRDGLKPADVARELKDAWGTAVPNLTDSLESLRAQMEHAAGRELTQLAIECDSALRAADYEAVIETLLVWNRVVMQQRGAAPWVRLGDSGRLQVRYFGNVELPRGDDLEHYWRNSYFLDSLQSIAFQIETGKV